MELDSGVAASRLLAAASPLTEVEGDVRLGRLADEDIRLGPRVVTVADEP